MSPQLIHKLHTDRGSKHQLGDSGLHPLPMPYQDAPVELDGVP